MYPTGRSFRCFFSYFDDKWQYGGHGNQKAWVVFKGWVLGFSFLLPFCAFFVIDRPVNLLSFKQLTRGTYRSVPVRSVLVSSWPQTATSIAGLFLLPLLRSSFDPRPSLTNLVSHANFSHWFLCLLGFLSQPGIALFGDKDVHTDTFAPVDIHTETHKWRHMYTEGTPGYSDMWSMGCWNLYKGQWWTEGLRSRRWGVVLCD